MNTPPLPRPGVLVSASLSSPSPSPPPSPPMEPNDGRTWSQDTSFLELAGDDFYTDISQKGEWHVSSAKYVTNIGEHACGVDELLADAPNTYWQTEGTVPHWVSIEYNEKTAVSFVAIFLDMATDESFTPKVVRVYTGESEASLKPPIEVYINLADRWRFIDLRPVNNRLKYTKTWIIKLEVLENWQDGRDCRIRHMRIIAPRLNDFKDPVIPIEDPKPGPSRGRRSGSTSKKKKPSHPFQPMPWISGPAIR